MPFPQQAPRAFTRENVETLMQGQMGVYGIFTLGGCVYVGRGDIRERLLAHLNGDNALITQQRPTYWLGAVTANYVELEKQLIVEFQPTCNRKVG